MSTDKEGTQIILLNRHNQVLMYLRDNKPDIPYPNQWSLLGGMLEQGETPAECVRREIEEEIGVALDADLIEHYATRDCVFGIEHTFFCAVPDLDIDTVTSTEGQGLRWFGENDVAATQLAYADNEILARFFADRRTTVA